jgi:hypothetical protein
VCSSVFLFRLESFDKILVNNPSQRTGVLQIRGVIMCSIVGSFACKDKGARYLAQLSYYHLIPLIDKVNKIYEILGSEKE